MDLNEELEGLGTIAMACLCISPSQTMSQQSECSTL